MAETKTTKTRRTRKPKEISESVSSVDASVEVSAEKESAITYTEADVQKMIAEAVRSALASKEPSTVVKVNEPVVRIAFMGKVSRDNQLRFGRFGSIYGNFGSIEVPRSAFGGEFMSSWVRKMLDERSLIVTDGLTDDERLRYGVLYKEGEVLSEQEYFGLLDMDADTICKRFKEVCKHFRILIASEIENARVAGDKRVNRDTIERLNNISRTINAQIYPLTDVRRMGNFAYTLREMGVVIN